MVYQDARTGTHMVSLSKLLDDGESVLALDIRVGDIEVEWEDGSDVFPAPPPSWISRATYCSTSRSARPISAAR